MSLSFTKEAVPSIPRTASELATLVPMQAEADGHASSGASASSSAVTTFNITSSGSTSTAFTTEQVIRALLSAAGSHGLLHPSQANVGNVALLVADDDHNPDYDFPEIDPGVPIASVGVDKFVLTDRSTDAPVLRVSIPQSELGRPRGISSGGSPECLHVLCASPGGGGAGRQFTVRLEQR